MNTDRNLTDNKKKREIRDNSIRIDRASNKAVITKTYKDGTKETIETNITYSYNHLKGGGYSSTRLTRKKQSDGNDENIENK